MNILSLLPVALLTAGYSDQSRFRLRRRRTTGTFMMGGRRVRSAFKAGLA